MKVTLKLLAIILIVVNVIGVISINAQDDVMVAVVAPQPPIADAGLDQIITLPTNSLTLNGTGTDPEGFAISTYAWVQLSGPSTATLSGEGTADLTASDLVEGDYVFELTVTDVDGLTGTDDVMVTVSPENTQGVVSFTLINAVTDLPVAGFDPIPNGASIDLVAIGTNQLSIRANTNPAVVGSVVFNMVGFNGGSDHGKTENVSPYALFGDTAGGTDYRPWSPNSPVAGYSYTLTGSAFDQNSLNIRSSPQNVPALPV